MNLEDIFFPFLFLWSTIAVLVFIALFYKNAPYGRYFTLDSNYKIPSRIGWIIMESPTIIRILIFIVLFRNKIGQTEIIICLLWLSHYIHRTMIWPFRAQLKGKSMAVGVVSMALFFNSVNISLQCIWIFIFGNYSDDWLISIPFIFGIILFFSGMVINIKSDDILIKLRKNNGEGYYSPQGFLYRYISCPNYFGEIIEWLGWAILTLSPSGLVFFIWTFANLVPRARSNHNWSKSNIPNYPKNRKAIFPYIY